MWPKAFFIVFCSLAIIGTTSQLEARAGTSCLCTGTDWVKGNGMDVPLSAVKAGTDADGGPLYVGRGLYEGELIPGKMVQTEGALYVAHEGKSVRLTDFQLLTTRVTTTWSAVSTMYTLPLRTIHGGYNRKFEDYYVCRATADGQVIPGKLDYLRWTCDVVVNKTEVASFTTFNVVTSAS